MEICSEYLGLGTAGPGIFLVHTNCADVKIVFVTDEIVRLRAGFDRRMAEESYVLTTTAWPDRMDALLGDERRRVDPVIPEVTEDDSSVVFRTERLILTVEKAPLCFTLCSSDQTVLYSTLPGMPFTLDGNRRVTAYSRMDEDDCFYGFGEKAGALNKNKMFLRERATDSMGYDSARTDTLYKHIPFCIRLNRASRRAVGVFFHNFYESVFNLGCEKSNYWPRYSYFQADGGDLDLFLIGGGSIARIVDLYTRLTGRPVLLPTRALGYQGSSMFYAELEENSDGAVLDFIDTLHEKGYPVDGFHLSSGFTSQNGKRCVFTWNRRRFPDPARFFDSMNQKGAPVAPNVKPGVLLCHPRLEEFLERGAFVADSHAPSSPGVGKWWGGDGVFWDFTSPKGRELWKQCLQEDILRLGTASVWNDNCEYDSLADRDCLVDFDGAGGTIAQLKPLMATLMCRTGAQAVAELDPDVRPYLICRSGSAGIQRYAQTWCGDNYTSWDTLRYNIPVITGMGLSGQPNEGGDIGGFAGPAPDEELFVRWVQQGIFQPRFSIHSASCDNTVTEPWMYPESEDLIRDAIRLRYRFAPYLYSHEYLASRTGAPIMRALVYEFQDDPNVYDSSFDYMFGRDLLVANVLEPGASHRAVYLPGDGLWYDWNDSLKPCPGGQTVDVPVSLSTIPMFVREGACIAMADNAILNLERDPVTDLFLLIAPKGRTQTVLYDDDGVSMQYRSGVYRKVTVLVEEGERTAVTFSSEGSYRDTVERVRIEMIAREKSPFWVRLGDQTLEHFLDRDKFARADCGWYYNQRRRTVEVKFPNPRRDICLTVSFEPFDLIGM